MPYDRCDIDSIVNYAKKLEGKTFHQVLHEKNLDIVTQNEIIELYGNKRRKGGLGNFLEEIYFGYKANSDSNADFHEVGVELKATPYEMNKKKEYRAGERLVLGMIDYNNPVELDLITSHLWDKMQKILLVYYFRSKEVTDKLEHRIDYTTIFTPDPNDLEIIKADYKKIVEKIAAGKAHELTESDTLYLGACTKGATAASSFVNQYYNPDIKAKKRAFSLKQSYMHTVLNNLINASSDTNERLVKSDTDLSKQTLEEFILNSLSQYYGRTDKELCTLFNREYNNNKAQWVELAYRMLGISSNSAEEFKKANIVVKSVRIESNGKIRESMSLPNFKFKELVNENWEESTLYKYFDQTKFLFIVYHKNRDTYTFNSAKFWNMPMTDLNGEVFNCWNLTKSKITEGITFIHSSKGILNDLPGSKENFIMHVRPHASRSAYQLHDGTSIGTIQKDAYELPDGQWMTRQSFWLNNEYILKQLLY